MVRMIMVMVVVMVLLIVPMLYYLRSIHRAQREAGTVGAL